MAKNRSNQVNSTPADPMIGLDRQVMVDAFFTKYGNYRFGSGPTVEELYLAFEMRLSLPAKAQSSLVSEETF